MAAMALHILGGKLHDGQARVVFDLVLLETTLLFFFVPTVPATGPPTKYPEHYPGLESGAHEPFFTLLV